MACRRLLPIFLGLTLLVPLPVLLPASIPFPVAPAFALPPSTTAKPPSTAPKPPSMAAKPPSTAPKPPSTAAEFFRMGRTAFLRQRFEEARAHFQKAYEFEPRDFLLFNLAVCYERLNRPSEAITHYRKYLRKVPAEATTLEPRLRELQRGLEPGRIRIASGIPGSDVWVDGRFAGQIPLKHPVWASPGSEVVIRVLRTGYHPFLTSLRVQAGTSVSLTIAQVPLEKPETRTDPVITILSAPLSPSARPPVDLRAEPVATRGSQLPITLGVAGTVLLSAGLCLGSYAWWKSGQTADLASWDWQRRDELERDSRRAAWGADALLITGTALVAAFGWMVLQD